MHEQKRIDLHVHSTSSDGTYTPTELVSLAQENRICAFALTDHDCILGIAEAVNAAKNTDVTVVPGVELSCEYCGNEIHMLGFYIDPADTVFCQKLDDFRKLRDERNKKMAALLAAEGFHITYEALLADNPDRIITRGNFAKFLVDHGCVKNRQTVFEKYLGDNGPCFVPRSKISVIEAIHLIHDAKGAAFLAHPFRYHMTLDEIRNLLFYLKGEGLDGVEAIYTSHDQGEERCLKAIARDASLMISGGSDFHGANKPWIHMGYGRGNLFVPREILTPIEQKCLLSQESHGFSS